MFIKKLYIKFKIRLQKKAISYLIFSLFWFDFDEKYDRSFDFTTKNRISVLPRYG